MHSLARVRSEVLKEAYTQIKLLIGILQSEPTKDSQRKLPGIIIESEILIKEIESYFD